MPWADLSDRVRNWLDADRAAAALEAERRILAIIADDLTGIYYDPVGGGPARCMGGGNQGGQAGEYPLFQVWNPTDSGVDVVVERCIIASGTTQYVTFNRNAAALETTTLVYRRRDTRTDLLPATQLRSGTAAAASGDTCGLVTLQADVSVHVDLDVCLGPGTGLFIMGTTLVTGLQAMFWWREYAPNRTRRG